MVYGKSELQPLEISWLREQTCIRTSFCKNLHAKCYLNEELCIVTSLNLYVVNSNGGWAAKPTRLPCVLRSPMPGRSRAWLRRRGSG